MSIVSSFPRDPDGKGRQKNKNFVFSGTTQNSDVRLVRNTLGWHRSDSMPEYVSPLSFQLREISDERILTIFTPHERFFLWYDVRDLERAAYDAFGTRTSFCCDWPRRSATLPQSATKREYGFDLFLLNGDNRGTVRLFRSALVRSSAPVLLKAPSGSEKTHLLQAAYRHLQERFHGNVLLFGSELCPAENTPALPRPSERPYSVVPVDDPQFLEASAAVQRMPASFLDLLSGQVLSGDGALIDELHNGLLSHLSLLLSAPDQDIRMRFTQMPMKRAGLPDHRDTALLPVRRCLKLHHIQGIPEHMPSSLRTKRPPAFTLGNEQHSELLLLCRAGRYRCHPRGRGGKLWLYLRSTYGKQKRKKFTPPRQPGIYSCRTILGENYPAQGRIFGERTTSIIMYPKKKIEKFKVMNKDAHILLTKLTKHCTYDAPGGPARL